MEKQKVVELTARQHTKVCRLIEKECCNFVDGICIIQDRGYGWWCSQIGTRILFCPWFKDAVLPINPALRNELLGDLRTCTCEMCGKDFTPKSNRARFCPSCGIKNRKRKKTEWMRKSRNPRGRLEPSEAACEAAFRTCN